MTTAPPDTIDVLVKSITHEAQGINAWEFRPLEGGTLPAFTAGAHIDLQLSNGLSRSYSLCNSQDERHRYVVAINNDPASRGGSRSIHETLKAGDTIRISSPRNNFPLTEDASHTVFIAGGIGITPIWSMIQRLEALGRPWQLHYSTRLRRACAFRTQLEELEQSRPGRVHFNFDQEPSGRMTDLKSLIASAPSDAHLYCCGPNSMLRAFEAEIATARWPSDRVHVEYFTPKAEAAAEGGFTVVLARSGKSVRIDAGKTILETLLNSGLDVPYSCMEGVCGTCETQVLEGTPDHRDSVLTPEQQAANKTMMICCSGSKGTKLILDL